MRTRLGVSVRRHVAEQRPKEGPVCLSVCVCAAGAAADGRDGDWSPGMGRAGESIAIPTIKNGNTCAPPTQPWGAKDCVLIDSQVSKCHCLSV